MSHDNHQQTDHDTKWSKGFFYSPFFLSITIGVPFCVYKILFGLLIMRTGNNSWPWILSALGCIGIIWAGLDLLMNLVRAAMDLIGSSGEIEFCSIAQVGRFFGVPSVFLALDTLVTFSIICFILWSGWIKQLTKIESDFWNLATTLNLISLSLVVLWTEINRITRKEVRKR